MEVDVVVGVVGVVLLASCVVTLKSLSLSGLGAGEIGRDGGLLGTVPGIVTALGGCSSFPRFSKRARIDDTAGNDEPSGPSSPACWSDGGGMMLLYGGAVGQCYPLHPRLKHLFHENIKML